MKTRITYPLACMILFLAVSCGEDMIGSDAPLDESAGAYLAFSGGSSGGTSGGPGQGSNEAGVITAGEWNDLEKWSFWSNLMDNQVNAAHRQSWGFFPENRYSLIIKDNSGQPIEDAEVVLKGADGSKVWTARSDNFGRAELFSGLFGESQPPASAVIHYQNQTLTIDEVTPFEQGINEVNFPVARISADAVDVMLVVDATGSMGDELEYLKKELYDVLDRANASAVVPLRTASVFYRDQGDEYITRNNAFTNNVSATVDFVKEQQASGGGDFPEAVHTALREAVEQGSWSSHARARILFLILDAPPHEDSEVRKAMRDITRTAAMKGIKIIPITASGIDKSTEFLMRFLSISTNGTYVFITNHSGIGNEHLEATVGEYEVEYLNDLMVRLIQKYSE